MLSNYHVFFTQMDLLGPQTQTATPSLLFWGASGSIPRPCWKLGVFFIPEASLSSHQGLPGTIVGRHLWETHTAGKKREELPQRKQQFPSISDSPLTSPLCFFAQIYSLVQDLECAWKNSWELLNKGFLPKEVLMRTQKLSLCSSRELS